MPLPPPPSRSAPLCTPTPSSPCTRAPCSTSQSACSSHSQSSRTKWACSRPCTRPPSVSRVSPTSLQITPTVWEGHSLQEPPPQDMAPTRTGTESIATGTVGPTTAAVAWAPGTSLSTSLEFERPPNVRLQGAFQHHRLQHQFVSLCVSLSYGFNRSQRLLQNLHLFAKHLDQPDAWGTSLFCFIF